MISNQETSNTHNGCHNYLVIKSDSQFMFLTKSNLLVMVQIHLLRISLNFGISISRNKSGIKKNQKRKNMCRCCKFLVCFIICFVSHIYANANDKRDYTYLFLYYMELSEEVKSTIEDFLQNNTHTKKNFYYLEISILYHETDTTRVHYRLKWINSPDRDKLVINEEIL